MKMNPTPISPLASSFSGVPYHRMVGKAYDAARLGTEFAEALPADKVV